MKMMRNWAIKLGGGVLFREKAALHGRPWGFTQNRVGNFFIHHNRVQTPKGWVEVGSD
jgi:hypothetical protein